MSECLVDRCGPAMGRRCQPLDGGGVTVAEADYGGGGCLAWPRNGIPRVSTPLEMGGGRVCGRVQPKRWVAAISLFPVPTPTRARPERREGGREVHSTHFVSPASSSWATIQEGRQCMCGQRGDGTHALAPPNRRLSRKQVPSPPLPLPPDGLRHCKHCG